jgi:transposase
MAFLKGGAPMTYKRRTYSGLFRGSPVNPFQGVPGIDIEIATIKTIGSLYLLKPFTNALQIREIVDRIVPMQRDVGGITHGQVIEQLVLNRLNDPCPLVHIEDWAENTGIPELFHILPDELNDDRLGRALDAISPYIDDIEEEIVLYCLSRYGKIDTDRILWDLTSFYFEGDYDESEMIKYGYNRDQKKDKKQAVVELNVTAGEGIPLAHRTLPGNASDQKEALRNLETLKKRLKNKNFMIIGDRALFTKANLAGLIGKRIDFVGPLAFREKEFILGFPEEQFQMLSYTTAKGKGGYSGIDTTYTFEHGGGYYTCRAVVVKSDDLYEQQRKTLERNLARVAADLQKISGHLNKRKYKNVDYAAAQIKKMLDGHGSYGKLFHVILKEDDDGTLSLTWEYETEALDQELRLLGKYVLATSLDRERYDPEAVLEAYKSRHRVEDSIRTTKSTLKIRPVFLQSDERIRSLVLVMIIALIVYALIEYVVRQEGLAKSAKQALFLFRMPAIVALRVNGHLVQQIGNISPFMLDVLDALKVKPLELDDV